MLSNAKLQGPLHAAPFDSKHSTRTPDTPKSSWGQELLVFPREPADSLPIKAP